MGGRGRTGLDVVGDGVSATTGRVGGLDMEGGAWVGLGGRAVVSAMAGRDGGEG